MYYKNIQKYYDIKPEFEQYIKKLCDIVESLIGAVYLDTQCNFEKTKKFTLELMEEKFILKFSQHDYASKHPSSKVKKLLDELKISQWEIIPNGN